MSCIVCCHLHQQRGRHSLLGDVDLDRVLVVAVKVDLRIILLTRLPNIIKTAVKMKYSYWI